MLRYRLIFGSLMIIFLTAFLLFGAWLDGSISSQTPDRSVQGSLLMLLVCLVALVASFEIAGLFKSISATIFKPLVFLFAIFLAAAWYFAQFFESPSRFISIYVPAVITFAVLAFFVYQHIRFGCEGTIVNCSVNCLAFLYLGALTLFLVAIRIRYGVWVFLMFIFVVKSADIGAYTIGRLLGRHKFAPGISPKKTWEGFAGGVAAAMTAAWLFARANDIMTLPQALCFGVVMAVTGQLGDLAESMLKRDAQTKDSATSVPGFGGVLDLIDSPVVAAVFAYLFLTAVIGG